LPLSEITADAVMQDHLALDARDPGAPAGEARGVRRVLRRAVWGSLRGALRTRAGLVAVNHLHRALSLPQKRRFFYLCFDPRYRVEGPWTVTFAGRRLVLPLHGDFELGWIAATAFHGYDTELHELYETLVRAPHPPRVFFDVGAGYGLHSLKLLAHGVRVVSFEPNTACHPFFLECCRRNGLQPDVRAVAVGDAAVEVQLRVPRGRPWLGTTTTSVARSWGDAVGVETLTVRQTTLDDVVRTVGLVPDLIKIDTEGGERAVLAGARAILASARPLIVLESWPRPPERAALFELLAHHHYRLHALRFAQRPSHALTLDAFVSCPDANFVARPAVLAA
jgi:FkbM family methyltransferase